MKHHSAVLSSNDVRGTQSKKSNDVASQEFRILAVIETNLVGMSHWQSGAGNDDLPAPSIASASRPPSRNL